MAAKVTSSGEYANSLLTLIFNATPYANIANNATVGPSTNLYVSLHTATPGANGNQTTNEAAYTSYARVAVTRTAAGWAATANSISPVSTIIFPIASGGSETETFFGVGLSSTGSGHLLYFGSVSPTIGVSSGVTPELTSGTTISEF